MASRYRAYRAATFSAARNRLRTRLYSAGGRSWLLHVLLFSFARQVEGHVDVFLDIIEPLFLEKANGRRVVCRGIDDDNPHALFLHASLDLLEQSAPHATLLNIPPHPKPDQVAVFPGRVVLLDCRPQGKSENFSSCFRHQAEFAVGIE